MSTTSSGGKRRLQKTVSLLIGALVLLSLSLYTPVLHADAVVSTIPVGTAPIGLGVDLQSNTIYVANRGDGTVSVINGNTNTVETVIPVAVSRGTVFGNPFSVAVNSMTGKIFVGVTSDFGNFIKVISDATHTVIATIQGSATAIAVNTVTNRVYVDGGDHVTVLDGGTYSVIASIPTPCQSGFILCSFGIAVNPATNTVYVSGQQQLFVIDGVTNAVIKTIPTAGVGTADISNVAVDSATNRIYVGANNGNLVYVVDGATNTIMTTIALNTGVRAVGVDNITNRIYADNGTITVIDGSANTIIQVVPVGSAALGLAVNAATNLIYVSNFDDNTVSVISGQIAETNTSTAVNCTPSTVAVNQPTQCTATVTDTSATPTSPTGNVTFSSSCSSNPPCGSFAPARTCKLSSASLSTSSCTVSYTPSPGTEGAQTVRAIYDADSTHQGSAGTTSLQVTQRSTSTTVSCSPSALRAKQSTTCVASVTDTSPGTAITPTGIVAWTSSGTGSFTPNPCTLSGTGSTATCTVTYTPSSGKASIQTIKGTYTGDTDHLGSSSNTTIAVA